MNRARDPRGRFRGIGRVVSPNKKMPSNTNLLVGKSMKGGKAGTIPKGSSTKQKPTTSASKKPIVPPTNPTVEAEVVGYSNHQPEKEEEEFNPILESEYPHIPSEYHAFKNIHLVEGEGEIHTNDGGEVHRTEEVTFRFPIVDPETNVQMKNINPSILPHFHGLVSEDPDCFLFEFDILCRSYDYTCDGQKLRLFPTTLKDETLHWFMGLGGDTIKTWEQMHN